MGVKVSTTEDYQQLYTPTSGKTMNVVVFGSGSGTILQALLRAQNSNAPFKIQAVVTDKKCKCCEIAENENIPLIYHSYLKFKKSHENEKTNEDIRSLYEKLVIQSLKDLSENNNFVIDIIFLAGYMKIVTPTLLNYFPNRILNVHPADLSILDDEGKRKYVGANAVYDALKNGEKVTRSCVIIVDDGVDTGPVIACGPTVTYTGKYPVTAESADDHQQKQKQLSDWPVAIKTLELISKGRVGIDKNNIIIIDSIPQGLCGYITKNF